MMDQTSYINVSGHVLGMIGSDEYFINTGQYDAFRQGTNYNYQKNAYTWEKEVYEGGEDALLDWNNGYRIVLRANIVLSGLEKIESASDDLTSYNTARGTALFHRAMTWYNLAQLYCPVYDAENADIELGLPLRTDPDVTTPSDWSSLEDTYRKIITDMQLAKTLLPQVPLTKFRPGKIAVDAFLARMYLQMGEFSFAKNHADQVLSATSTLIDFNELTNTDNHSFPVDGSGNPEVIYFSRLSDIMILSPTYFNADTLLLESYEDGDLRKTYYFKENASERELFMGSYSGDKYYFTGLATDEVFLIKAECEARLGDTGAALAALNRLRKHRLSTDQYVALESQDISEVLDLVIAERRKELVMRGTRWEDIRRLNKEERYETALVRQLGDRRIELLPGSDRFIWSLPLEVITPE